MSVVQVNLNDTKEVKKTIQLIYDVFVSCNKKHSTEKLIHRMEKLYGPGYDYIETLYHFKKTPIFFVVKEQDRIIGMIRGTKEKIINLYIDPNKQGMHIGKKLLNIFEKKAKKLGSNCITLKSSAYGLSFYVRAGYTPIEKNILEKQL